ncbi:histidine kinase, partial [Mesorhizobium sp. M2D.F.Ca.ET.171.01.1.1]
GHSLWDWDIPGDRVTRTPALGEDAATGMLARVHGEDIVQVRAALDEHLRGHSEQYSAQFRFRQADGQWRWVLDRGRVVARTADGQPLRMVGT